MDLNDEMSMLAFSTRMQTIATQIQRGDLKRDTNLQLLGEVFAYACWDSSEYSKRVRICNQLNCVLGSRSRVLFYEFMRIRQDDSLKWISNKFYRYSIGEDFKFTPDEQEVLADFSQYVSDRILSRLQSHSGHR